jgi:protein-tyrosine phosphatase
MHRFARLAFLLIVSAGAASGAAALGPDARVERLSGQQLAIRWSDAKAVDVYTADRPDTPLKAATLVSAADADGEHVLAADPSARRYVLLHDKRSGEVRRLAERLVPLEAGSNFRDLGGYPAAGGKHVRWGMVYRSAGQPMLNDRDLALIKSLSLANLVDLRSMEERRLAPTRIAGVPYNAIGYPFMSITSPASRVPGAAYRNFPELMAPHLTLIFNKMLGEGTPLAFNCSAGQDRTGFVAAMILTALGVPGEVILEDYHLTTAVRQPQFEMPRIDPVASANDPVALMFAGYQKADRVTLTPLRDPQGKAFLTQAFEAIEAQYGSVDAYLQQAAGLTPARRKRLKATYLE